jgi:glutathione S-transferase
VTLHAPAQRASLTLWHIPYSPWSLKARAALRHHGIEVALRLHAPLVNELALRLKLGKLFGGRVTVPVLFTPEGPVLDSFSIAEYADRVGSGTPLIDAPRAVQVRVWNTCSERLMSAGRARSMLRALASPQALRETMPPALRALPLPLMLGSVRTFNLKYGIRSDAAAANLAIMREELERLREALAGGRDYLLGSTLSYADLAMALALQLVLPLPGTPLGPASLITSTEPELAGEYADVLAWRDRLHARHPLLA